MLYVVCTINSHDDAQINYKMYASNLFLHHHCRRSGSGSYFDFTYNMFAGKYC